MPRDDSAATVPAKRSGGPHLVAVSRHAANMHHFFWVREIVTIDPHLP
jgi:hypothetical protein